MAETPRMKLPLIAASQAQKHVPANESFKLLDALVHMTAISMTLTDPPGAPAEGDLYIAAATPTGAWAGGALNVFLFTDGNWLKIVPFEGMLIWAIAESNLFVWDGDSWEPAGIEGPQGATGSAGAAGPAGPTGPAGASSLTICRAVATANVALATALAAGQTIDGVTLATNDRVLLAGQTAAEENGVYVAPASGAASRDTAFDAYDELPGVYFSVMEGTAKADTLWRCTSDRGGTIDVTAVAIEEATFGGAGAGRELLTANRTYFVNGATGDDGNDGLSSGAAFATIQKALDTVGGLDLGVFAVTIQVANGTYSENLNLPVLSGAGSATLRGDTTTPSNVTISGTSPTVHLSGATRWTLEGFKITASGAQGILLEFGAGLTIANLEFGAVGVYHMRAQFASAVVFSGNYSISGGAGVHMWASESSTLFVSQAITVTLSGTPAFSTAFAQCQRVSSMQAFSNVTYSGAATGKRFNVEQNAVFVGTGSATFLPGDAAGTTATGGVYI